LSAPNAGAAQTEEVDRERSVMSEQDGPVVSWLISAWLQSGPNDRRRPDLRKIRVEKPQKPGGVWVRHLTYEVDGQPRQVTIESENKHGWHSEAVEALEADHRDYLLRKAFREGLSEDTNDGQ
jgi:hypothetical protein